jgi:hypothetical protein
MTTVDFISSLFCRIDNDMVIQNFDILDFKANGDHRLPPPLGRSAQRLALPIYCLAWRAQAVESKSSIGKASTTPRERLAKHGIAQIIKPLGNK